jgi:hypothetical protein
MTMQQGLPRTEVLALVRSFFDDAHKARRVVCGHNLVKFDLPVLFRECIQTFGHSPELHENQILDTGMLVKAVQANLTIQSDETLWDFFNRVADARHRVRWSLSDFCLQSFNLEQRFGVKAELMHASPLYDCFVTGLLLKSLMELHNDGSNSDSRADLAPA